jgi:hypothetical protein
MGYHLSPPSQEEVQWAQTVHLLVVAGLQGDFTISCLGNFGYGGVYILLFSDLWQGEINHHAEFEISYQRVG